MTKDDTLSSEDAKEVTKVLVELMMTREREHVFCSSLQFYPGYKNVAMEKKGSKQHSPASSSSGLLGHEKKSVKLRPMYELEASAQYFIRDDKICQPAETVKPASYTQLIEHSYHLKSSRAL